MATPKTDIEQSVGRILREKHSNPVVVDIVDSHDLFKNQWQKRRKFYCKENYKILYTTSKKYNPDTTTIAWRVSNEPNINKNASPFCKMSSNNSNLKTKTSSFKSTSSSDKSIANDSDVEEDGDTIEKKDNLACGKCLLTFKKK